MNTFTSLIITYNSLNEIGDLLYDLIHHVPTNPLVVIDNASKDGSADLVSSQFPFVHLVRNELNIGFSRAVNQGASICKTPYILLLNPDIRILDENVLAEMLVCLERQPQVAVVAPLQFKDSAKERHLNFTWSYLSPQAFMFFIKHRFHLLQPRTAPMPVPFLNMGCLMLRREAFERVGKLNEMYFLYGEEPDLFLKFMRYGYECCLLPYVSIIHYRERSIGKVEPLKQMSFRVMGLGNIIHALAKGYGSICFDYLITRLLPERSRDLSGRR
jgi:GT2 family glycosyltransferase